MYTIRTHRLFRKKPSKPLQNTLFYALVSIICGGKPLITTNKLAGPVGKKGVLGGVYRLRNAWKTTKNITEPVTKWVNSKRCGLNRGCKPPGPPFVRRGLNRGASPPRTPLGRCGLNRGLCPPDPPSSPPILTLATNLPVTNLTKHLT